MKCDILVVGCGPAGASAARAAAIRGAKVICIDRKKEIGTPVKCAEGIGDYLLPYLPFTIPKNQLKWRIDGIRFWVDGQAITRQGKFWGGYTLERDKFEQWLAKEATNAGALVQTNTNLIKLKVRGGIVEEATVVQDGRETSIKAKMIIAADGSESTALSLLGLYKQTEWNTAEVYSWEMHGLKLEQSHLEQIYIGDFAPGGYGYIFPKSDGTANVGVGASTPEFPLREYYNDFLELSDVKQQVSNGVPVREKTKKAVWGDITEELIHGNVIVSGDAANHNLKPFIEGILPAVISGDLAGEIAYTISNGKPITGEQYLDRFQMRLHPHFGVSSSIYQTCNSLFQMRHKKKYMLFAGLAAQLFELEEIEKLKQLDYGALKTKFIEESKRHNWSE